MRLYRDKELDEMRAVFLQQDDKHRRGALSSSQVHFATFKVDLELDRSCFAAALEAEIPPNTPTGSFVVDMAAFVRIVTAMRDGARREFQSNGCFSEEELGQLRQQFVKYDTDGSGDITNKELVCLIQDAFPEMANDPKMRPFLTQMLHEIDADESGSLDFQEYLSLMQQLRDLQDRARVAKEHRAIQETRFSTQEVQEFREVFLTAAADDVGVLTLSQVCDMLQKICPLGDQNRRRLTEIFRDITAAPKANSPQDTADFPEFLWLMRKLLDVNLAGLGGMVPDGRK
jgi:calmodulin